MRTGTTLLLMLLAFPLMVACGNQKAASGQVNNGVKDLTGDVSQNQRLNTSEVDRSKDPRYVNTNSGQKQVVSASSYQKPIVYATDKNKKQKDKKKPEKSEKQAAVVTTAPATQTPAVVAVTEKPKDTMVIRATQPTIIIKADTTVPKPLFNPALMGAFLRTPAQLKKFNVVIGSFSTLEKASVAVAAMQKLHFKPVIVPNEKGMYRVIVGSYPTRETADLDVLGLQLNAVKAWVWTK